jgi:RNA polymerase sigma-70 factor (ECF subfamily)
MEPVLTAVGKHSEMPVAEWLDPAARSFDELYRAEFTSVVRLVFLITHDAAAAEDAAQEAFARLFSNWSKVSGYDKPQAWVRRVAIRIAVRSTRRRELLGRLTHLYASRARNDDSQAFELALALRQLPMQQRAAIALHYYEDRPLAEVASLLGCSESTAKVHVFRARRRLAQLLGDTIDEADNAG